MTHRIAPILAAVAAVLLILANCNKGDRIAPEDATIDLAASPTTVVLVDGSGTSDIVATVSSVAGVPLPDQDVRFTNTAGTLEDSNGNPAANLPIRTDSYGNAHVVLITNKTTTVSGRSGKATGSITLDTVSGNFDHLRLTQDISSSGCIQDQVFRDCGEVMCLVVQALDSNGGPVQGVTIALATQDVVTPDGSGLGTIQFANQNNTDVTNADGELLTGLKLGSDCQKRCVGTGECSGYVVASLRGGSQPTAPYKFSTNIQ